MLGIPHIKVVAIIFIALSFVGVVAWSVLYPMLLRQLRTSHGRIWEELGRPKYIELRFRPAVAALNFLLQRHYLVVEDESFVKLAAWTRMAFIGSAAALALYLVLVLIIGLA